MKGIFHKLITYGISKDTGLREHEQIKIKNIFSLIFIGLLIASIVTGLFQYYKYLLLIEVVSAVFYIGIYFIFPPSKMPNTWNFLSLTIIATNVEIGYFIITDISVAVLMFIMMFPIAVVVVMGRKKFWASLILLFIIIFGNIFPPSNGFIPLSNINIVLYSIAYIVMIITSNVIYKILDGRISDQIKKVAYFEKEISQRDAFIAKLSHKLRTSLSNITLINNMVHDSRMSSAQKELLDTLKMSTIDLINNVNELVEIATPSIIDYKQSILSFNLGEALSGTVDILESDKGLDKKIKVSCAENIDYYVIGDPSLLRLVLINLTKGISRNDISSKEFVIEVSLDYEAPNMYGLKFSLHYNSQDENSIEQAVALMKKGSDTESLHFNLANRFLSLTSSKLEYSSEPDDQAVIFFLDFAKDLTRKIVKTGVDEKTGKGIKEKSLQESTLLLVEDNAINQKVVLLSLNKMVKKIDVANNGKEALDMFGTKKYDAILMDIQMPVMDGITATKKIREIETTSDERIPILAITANVLAGDRDNCLAAGADDYLSKPFHVEDLVDRISTLLAR